MPADLGVDIDSLLAAAADDLQSKLDAAQPEAAPVQAPAPIPEPAPAASPDMTADLGVDIDSLLAAAADDLQGKLDAAQPEAAPVQAPAPAPEPQPDLNADLDSLLAAVTGGAAPAAEPQEDVSGVLLHPELELMTDIQPEPVAEALHGSLPELEPVLEPVQATQPEQAVELPTDFDALLAAAADQAATDHADVAPADVQDIIADASAQAESDVFEAVAAAEPAQADDLRLLEPDGILPPDANLLTGPSVDEPAGADLFTPEPAAVEAVEVEPAAADMPESAGQFAYEPAFRPQAAHVTDSTDIATDVAAVAVSGAALEAVMEQAKEASSHAIDAFAQAFDASTRAADAAETASKLTARVEQCEAALQEAGVVDRTPERDVVAKAEWLSGGLGQWGFRGWGMTGGVARVFVDALGDLRGQRILEIGTSRGYLTMILCMLGARVTTVDKYHRGAKTNLQGLDAEVVVMTAQKYLRRTDAVFDAICIDLHGNSWRTWRTLWPLVAPRVRPGGKVVIDNATLYTIKEWAHEDGVRRLYEQLRHDPAWTCTLVEQPLPGVLVLEKKA